MTIPKLKPAVKRLIDEYAEVQAKVAAWRPPANPHAARLAELTAAIAQITEAEPDDAEVLLVGFRYNVPVTAKRIKRTIVNVRQLFKRLGSVWVEAHCQPNLSDLDKALGVEERKAFVEESRTLSRIIGDPVAAAEKRKAA